MALTDNLVSVYLLNGDATDAHGSNDGTATDVSYVSGKLGQAGSFNGSSSYINFGSSLLSGVSEFSISFWHNLNAMSGDYDFFVKGDHASNEPFVFWADNDATNHYAFLVTDSNGDYSGAYYSASEIVTGAWKHVTLTFDGDNEVRLFIDGAEDSNSPFSISNIGEIADTGDDFLVGCNLEGDEPNWKKT